MRRPGTEIERCAKPTGPKFEDLTGRRFARLMVLDWAGKLGGRSGCWSCQCDCGKLVEVRSETLKNGRTRSCGCLNVELAKGRATHGQSQTPEWGVWNEMRQRCYNPNATKYLDYGARGITVCDRWRDAGGGFERFISDVGPRPTDGRRMIERRDNDGPYSPENCYWATPVEQGRNTRANVWIAYKGETKRSWEWEEATGIPAHIILKRIGRGWTAARALTKRVRPWP